MIGANTAVAYAPERQTVVCKMNYGIVHRSTAK